MKNKYYDIVLSPIITEKSSDALEHGKVIFKVAKSATKPQIKEAIEALFEVKVKSVNTIIQKGKVKRFRGILGKRSDFKKAIVSLEEGHSIDVSTGL